MSRPITSAEMEALFARNLPDRQFRREVFAIEHGARALKLRDLQARRDVTADLYKQALNAAVQRQRDGSLRPYQLRTLTQAFASWQAAVLALADFQSSRRVPAAAE